MEEYKIGDKLKCIALVNSTQLEMCNPNVDIHPGTIVEIKDMEVFSDECSWFLLANEKFAINAWSDAPDHLISKWFTKI